MPRSGNCFLMQLSFRDEGHEKPQDLTVEGSTQVELLSDASSVDSASKSIMSIPSHVLGDVMQTPSWTVAAGSPICQGAKKGILKEGVIFEDCATRLLPWNLMLNDVHQSHQTIKAITGSK